MQSAAKTLANTVRRQCEHRYWWRRTRHWCIPVFHAIGRAWNTGRIESFTCVRLEAAARGAQRGL